jgi:hypothetical protein
MLGRSVLELSKLVWGTDKDLLAMIHVTASSTCRRCAAPGDRARAALHRPQRGGIRVAYECPGTASIYSRQKNPVLDEVFLKARTRFGDPCS